MPIELSENEKNSISSTMYQDDVINRMIILINDLEARIIVLENE